jgi:hypothetical protein
VQLLFAPIAKFSIETAMMQQQLAVFKIFAAISKLAKTSLQSFP